MLTEAEKLKKQISESFERWEHIYTHGGSDPFWEDGLNLNLVRNHIIYYKNKLLEIDGSAEILQREIPPEVDNLYIARKNEIRNNAEKSFKKYEKDKNYQYILANRNRISEREAEKISLGYVLGYVKGLRNAIDSNDYVSMRRHEHYERYMEAFDACAERMRNIIVKSGNYSVMEEKSGQMCFA